MMLKATIDADILKESIDAISALVTECRLHTDENGFSPGPSTPQTWQ